MRELDKVKKLYEEVKQGKVENHRLGVLILGLYYNLEDENAKKLITDDILEEVIKMVESVYFEVDECPDAGKFAVSCFDKLIENLGDDDIFDKEEFFNSLKYAVADMFW